MPRPGRIVVGEMIETKNGKGFPIAISGLGQGKYGDGVSLVRLQKKVIMLWALLISLGVASIMCTILCGTAFSEDKGADDSVAARIGAIGKAETKLDSLSLVCAGTNATIDVFRSMDLDLFEARKVVVRTVAEWGDENVLTLVTGSFGVECRKNPLGWQGYIVFQTACPVKGMPSNPSPRCDFKNYFGIIRESTVLIVPDERNGRLAASIFNYPSNKTFRMKQVRTLFNLRKDRSRQGKSDASSAIDETYIKEVEKILSTPEDKAGTEPDFKKR